MIMMMMLQRTWFGPSTRGSRGGGLHNRVKRQATSRANMQARRLGNGLMQQLPVGLMGRRAAACLSRLDVPLHGIKSSIKQRHAPSIRAQAQRHPKHSAMHRCLPQRTPRQLLCNAMQSCATSQFTPSTAAWLSAPATGWLASKWSKLTCWPQSCAGCAPESPAELRH